MLGHGAAVDGIRQSSEKLLDSNLSEGQRQLVLDMMNAAQDLNTRYWEQVYANTTTSGLTQADLARLAWEAGPCERETAERIASHIVANARGANADK